jgi:hypothetical protein
MKIESQPQNSVSYEVGFEKSGLNPIFSLNSRQLPQKLKPWKASIFKFKMESLHLGKNYRDFLVVYSLKFSVMCSDTLWNR